MKASKFEQFKWIAKGLFTFLKSSYPLTKLGARMVFGALAVGPISAIVIQITFPNNMLMDSISITGDEASVYSILSAMVVAIIGFWLIYIEQSSNARHTARVLITGLPSTNSQFPEGVLSVPESREARESVRLGTEENSGSLKDQITRFNSEVCVDLFNRFIVHDNCKKLYIGGLARVPFLVAYGSLLRNLTATVVYFDKFHRNSEWKTLNEENKQVTLSYDRLIATPNENGDIGIALGFSTPINKEQLPNGLTDHTTIISPSLDTERNLIQNQENLESISSEIQSIIDELSASSGVKRIHLFLSVQSSLAIQIGRRFQEGIHLNWIVHNFRPDIGQYEWALEISKSGVEEY